MRERGLADTGSMVCTAGLDTIKALGLQVNMLARTRLVVRGVKRSRLTVLGAVVVEISAGGRTSYQILYVTEETKQLILSRTCLEQLGVVTKDFHTNGGEGEVMVTSGEESNLGGSGQCVDAMPGQRSLSYRPPCLGHQLRTMQMPWSSG